MNRTRAQCGLNYKTFLGVVYTASSIFPYDFDLGYADSNVITLKKSFITLAFARGYPFKQVL